MPLSSSIRRFLAIGLFCLASTAAFAADAPPVRLRAAVLMDFPPQYGLSAQGRPEGFAIDVIKEVARLADADIDFVVMESWQQAFRALRSGDVDLIPNQGITDRRKQWFAFTSPVETFSVRIFVRRTTDDIAALDDLAGKKVGAVRLNIGEKLLAGRPDIDSTLYAHLKDALFDLLAGRLDALVFPEPMVRWLVRRARLENRIKAVGPPLVEIKRAISVARSNTALRNRLDRAVGQFVASPAYRRIYTRWYGKPEPLLTTLQAVAAMAAALLAVIIAMTFWRYRSLVRINADLTRTVRQREQAEQALQEAHDRLEDRVNERTAALTMANRELTREIEGRALAEKQLRENERFLAWVLDSIQDGISVLSTDLTIVRANRAMRTWFSHHLPLEGKPCHEAFRESSEPCSDCPSLRAVESRKIEVAELPRIQDGRKTGTLEVYAFPMIDETGTLTGVVEYIRDITEKKRSNEEREQLIAELQEALDNVRTLSGLLPICASCKKIRDDSGYWNQIESFISDHSEAMFSHSICPECAKALYPDLKLEDG